MALPKWTDERTAQLTAFVGNESPVSQATVAEAAETLETSTRSIASKLRKMGFDVELSSAAPRSYSPEQEAALADFVVENSGNYTYSEIAAEFENGAFSAKSIQGKILSMELTAHVKPTPKAEAARTYTPAEEAQFVQLANSGSPLEAIAEALGRSINSIRGKALSLLRTGEISAIPKQNSVKAAEADVLEGLNVEGMTVEAIAESVGKSIRGVKTMLTRRGLKAADYDGAAKREKADSK